MPAMKQQIPQEEGELSSGGRWHPRCPEAGGRHSELVLNLAVTAGTEQPGALLEREEPGFSVRLPVRLPSPHPHHASITAPHPRHFMA